MPQIEEVFDDDLGKATPLKPSFLSRNFGFLPSWKSFWTTSVDYGLATVDWAVIGFLGIGKVVWWSVALTILIAIPTVKVLDTATALENELKNSTMNREIHESTGFDIDPLNPAALVTL
mmetsp:Transcript_1593/g.2482  ORF Transcript_1593/g.2482 Transcript_1593/m.2482 type:complete len:119 (+) Transcript_1593:42-398(+)